MNRSYPATNYSTNKNVNRKRPLATNPVTAASSLSDVDAFAMATDNNVNLMLPSALNKKKKQQKSTPSDTMQQQDSSPEEVTNISPRIMSQRNVPAFLHKLYNMVDDPSTDPLVRWSKNGNSFLVIGHEEFAKTILPRFYKHNTFASFVRQLNMYDFHKIPNIQQSIIQSRESEIWEFSSPNFQKGRPDLLVYVTRKRIRNSNANQQKDDQQSQTDIDKMNLASFIKDITSIKHHQSNITKDLTALHRDNEIIWQETLLAREKHELHQQILSKILQFLIAVFSNDMKALSDLSNEEATQAQHISQGHEQAILRKNNNHSCHDQSDSGISSDNNSNTGYFASDSSNDNSQPDSKNNSSSGSGSEDDANPISNRTNTLHKEPSTFSSSSSSPFYSPGLSKPSNMKQHNMQRSKLSSTPVDVDKLDKLLSNSFNPTIVNKGKGPAKDAPQEMISVLAPHVLGNNSRTAREITNDIDQLQVNVETLASQLGIDPSQYSEKLFNDYEEFSENYSMMISSASRMDKFRLFALGGESPPSHQQTENGNLFVPPYDFMPNANNSYNAPNMVDTNYHTASTYFRQLLRSSETKILADQLMYQNNNNIPLQTAKKLDSQLPTMPTMPTMHSQMNNNTMFGFNASGMIPDPSFSSLNQQRQHKQQ